MAAGSAQQVCHAKGRGGWHCPSRRQCDALASASRAGGLRLRQPDHYLRCATPTRWQLQALHLPRQAGRWHRSRLCTHVSTAAWVNGAASHAIRGVPMTTARGLIVLGVAVLGASGCVDAHSAPKMTTSSFAPTTLTCSPQMCQPTTDQPGSPGRNRD